MSRALSKTPSRRSSTASRKHVVRQARQVKALSGPLQHQIIATIERLGPSTARQLAQHVGVAAESLYYHLRRLKAAGLLLESELRPTTRRPEAVFALPGNEIVLDPENQQESFLDALAAVQRSLLAMATRLYARALKAKGSVRSGPRRNLCVIQQNARLRPRDLAELNRRLEALAEFVAEHDDPAVESFLSVTISMSPATHE